MSFIKLLYIEFEVSTNRPDQISSRILNFWHSRSTTDEVSIISFNLMNFSNMSVKTGCSIEVFQTDFASIRLFSSVNSCMLFDVLFITTEAAAEQAMPHGTSFHTQI